MGVDGNFAPVTCRDFRTELAFAETILFVSEQYVFSLYRDGILLYHDK